MTGQELDDDDMAAVAHNDQMAAIARDDLAKLIPHARQTVENVRARGKRFGDVDAIAVIAMQLFKSRRMTRIHLASLLATAVLQLSRVPEQKDVMPEI